MKIQGNVVQLERKSSDTAALSFWLVTAKDKIPVESAADSPIKEGDTVEVVGDTNSNGTLIAQSIRKVTAAPVHFPWKPVLAAVAGVIVLYGVYQFLQPPANSSYSVRAAHCNVGEPNVTVTMTNAKGTSYHGVTNTQGACTITKLAAGTYTLQAGTARRTGIVIDGKTVYKTVPIEAANGGPCGSPKIPRFPLDTRIVRKLKVPLNEK